MSSVSGLRVASDAGPLRVLLVEDNPGDTLLLRMQLEEEEGAFQIRSVESLTEMARAASAEAVDVLLLDLSLPGSRGLDTLTRALVHLPRVPIVVLTGLDDEEVALQAIHAGAQDYLVKGAHDRRALKRAIRYAVERRRILDERDDLIRKLEEALANVKTLRGLLPICANCKRVRDDKGYWSQIEQYLHDRADIDVTHGICPECRERLYPGYGVGGGSA